jgi:hypothetical protein
MEQTPKSTKKRRKNEVDTKIKSLFFFAIKNCFEVCNDNRKKIK